MLCAGSRPGDWSGPYPPCDRHSELTKKDHMDLGVRFYTSDPELRAAIAQAMDFWAAVLDLSWHEEDSRNCAMQVVDGHGGLFKPAEVARSQFPGRRTFQGWIAFNPKAELTLSEKYSIAVHEVGHVLGLPHNPSARSVMYYLRLDGLLLVDAADLAMLSARHRLRGSSDTPRVVPASSAPSWSDARIVASKRRPTP
jgi:hypothetical protein